MQQTTYAGSEKMWLYPGETASWHFITVPKKSGAEIKETHGKQHRGFGSLPVEVTIGHTTWQTSIFFDKRMGTYLLPVKAKVRRAEDLYDGETIEFKMVIQE